MNRALPSAIISGSGFYVPPETITTQELVESFNCYAKERGLKESSVEFITKASGIHKRHVIEKSGILDPSRMAPRIKARKAEEPSLQAELGIKAAHKALEAAGKSAEEIDLVLFTSLAPQRDYPSIAVEIQKAIGAKGYGYDLTAGCSSMAVGLEAISNAIKAGKASSALLISVELGSCWTDFTDRDSHFIFGDAAVALVIEQKESAKPGRPLFEILDSRVTTQFSPHIKSELGYLHRLEENPIPFKETLFRQQGRLVFREVVPFTVQFLNKHLHDQGLSPDKIVRFYLHQANSNINRLILEKLLGRTPSLEEAPITLDNFGNTASAGAFLTLHLHQKELSPGDLLLLSTFGAGYTLASAFLKVL